MGLTLGKPGAVGLTLGKPRAAVGFTLGKPRAAVGKRQWKIMDKQGFRMKMQGLIGF